MSRCWLFRKKSYAERKRELEEREEIYSRMQSLSDGQIEKWLKVRNELRKLRNENTVCKIVRINKESKIN